MPPDVTAPVGAAPCDSAEDVELRTLEIPLQDRRSIMPQVMPISRQGDFKGACELLDQLLAQVGAPTATVTAQTTPTPMPTPIPGPIGIIDTHTHLQGPGGATVSGLQQAALAALDFMKQSGIQKTLMMNPPSHRESKGFDADQEFFNIVQQYPDSFAFLGGGPTLSPLIIESAQEGQVTADVLRSFEDRAEAIVQMGAAGFGETAALHISFVEGLPFIEIPADTTLFLLLADIAARNDMPIDLHMEAVAEDMALPDGISLLSNPSTLRENISGLERLLAHNRDARIVWSHAGWDNTGHRTVALMRRLLETHTNLYMNIKLPIGGGRDDLTPPENQPVDDNGRIRPQWLDLLQAFPDRFVLGSEAFYDIQAMARGASRAQSPFIDQLPPDLARKVGYENAARIYRLAAAPTATPTPTPTPTPAPTATPTPTPLSQGWPPIVDVHSHWPLEVTVQTMLQNMDAANVLAAVIMPSGGQSFGAALGLQKSYPDRFLALLGFQNSGWTEGTPGFLAGVEEKLQTGQFKGLGEVLLRHYAIPARNAPDVFIDADAPNSLRALDLAATYKVPVILHMEAEEGTLEKLRSALEQKPVPLVIWAHAGRATADTVDSFLSTFPNLYIDLAALGPVIPYGREKNPITNAVGILTPEWKTLLIKFQDRVFVGADPPFTDLWNEFKYIDFIQGQRTILRQLPDEIAEKLAFRNAARVFNLEVSE